MWPAVGYRIGLGLTTVPIPARNLTRKCTKTYEMIYQASKLNLRYG